MPLFFSCQETERHGIEMHATAEFPCPHSIPTRKRKSESHDAYHNIITRSVPVRPSQEWEEWKVQCSVQSQKRSFCGGGMDWFPQPPLPRHCLCLFLSSPLFPKQKFFKTQLYKEKAECKYAPCHVSPSTWNFAGKSQMLLCQVRQIVCQRSYRS